MNEKRSTLSDLDSKISQQIVDHGDEIRALADKIDSSPNGATSKDALAVVEEEVRRHYAQASMDERSDDDDTIVEKSVTNWMELTIGDSTENAVAASYVLLGREEARRRFGQDGEHTFRVAIMETQQVERIYTINAEDQQDAFNKAMTGDTIGEKTVKIVSVLKREDPRIAR